MDIIAFHACDDLHSARTQEQHYFEEYKATLNSMEPLPKPKITIEHEKKENPENDINPTNLIPEKDLKKSLQFSCEKCQYATDDKSNYTKHFNIKHRTGISAEPRKYVCEPCSFVTTIRGNHARHLNTPKHFRNNCEKNNIESNDVSIPYNINKRKFICECGGVYSYRQSLFKHKQRCTFKKDDNKILGLTEERFRQLVSQAVSAGLNSLNSRV
jgi:hypothetical protein